MAKGSRPTIGRDARASNESTRARPGKTTGYGSRAVPGKAPRGSLPRGTSSGFAPFARSILEKIDRGVVLLDAMGVVIDANSIARQVLTNGNGVLLRNGRFSFADAETEGRFEQLLQATGKPNGAPRAVAASVKRQGSATCRVLVSPIMIEDGQAHSVAYVVIIYAPAEQRAITHEVLLEIYGLTRAQADVARQLYAGLSVEETAAQLQLSLNTVRTHLKQIFSKCNVQSQAELLHTLALGPQSF
ncbi:MAG: helix-turn-helix transcriptional regulator [Steroidobacteraceae bacterium]